MDLINPGADAWMIARQDPLYVDKTGMLEYLNCQIEKPYRYIAVTRIRRFGKTTDMNMTGAYYDRTVDGAAAFAGLQIANSPTFDQYRNKYNVISINMLDMLGGREPLKGIHKLTVSVLTELAKKFPDIHFEIEISLSDFLASANEHIEARERKQSSKDIPPASCSELLMNALDAVYKETGVRFVFLIDEWDAFFRNFPEQNAQNNFYLDFLRDVLKDKNYIALTYMTGILPIKKYGQHSALNMFDEFTMTEPGLLAPYVGFTEDEVRTLCQRFGQPFEAYQHWYDGYLLESIPFDVTNPYKAADPERIHVYARFSVIQAIRKKKLGNYWNQSETLQALQDAIRLPFGDIKFIVHDLMQGKRRKIDTRSYQNDMTSFTKVDDVLTMLVHLGYLAYDSQNEEVFIPNQEIMNEFQSMVKDSPDYDGIRQIVANSRALMQAIWDENPDDVANYVQQIMDTVDQTQYYNEQVLVMAIRTGLLYGESYYTFFPEVNAGLGRADLVGIPRPNHPEVPALIFETKINKTAKSALDQLHQKKYPLKLQAYASHILFIGVNYDKTIKSTNRAYKKWTDVVIEHGL